MENKIKEKTRQNIATATVINKIYYCGKMNEPDFLSRLFDLTKLPSRDYRYHNAYDDINKHTVYNDDYSENWIYTDPRINLLHCPDELYLKFLSETVHPIVRSDANEIAKLIEIYNSNLSADGFEIIQSSEISKIPVYSGQQKNLGDAHISAQKVEIKKYLNTEYVNNKIRTMTEAINKDTDLAIGTAKELLETTCKSILKQKNVETNPNWTLPQLIKQTSQNVDLEPKNVADTEKAQKSILQILSGISSIVQGVTELRNSYGTGHGKDADFKGLEIKYAKLVVGAVSEIVIFYLAANGETELTENP
jgi:hypothetical protein